MNMMALSFEATSPRLRPRPVPIASRVIGAIGPLLFLALVAQFWLRAGVGAWAVGITYILYDTALLAFTAMKLGPLRRTTTPAAPAASRRPTMAVIVAAHNEAPVLKTTIDALIGQSALPDLILLADDGSDDDSAKVLCDLYGLETPVIREISAPAPYQPRLRWLRLPRGGKARALNAAMLQANAEIMLTIDADTLLAPGALEAMRDAFATEPELVAATGVLTPICGSNLTGRLFQWFQRQEYMRNFLSRYAWMQTDSLLLISGAFAAFRRDAVVEIGGFDPDSMVEDYELIHRLLRHAHDTKRDWRTRVIGRALASTDAPASPIAFLRQRRRWFGGFLQTQRWNRDMVGNRRYGKLGKYHLPVKALDTLQPVYGLAAFLVLAGFVVTGRFRIALPVLVIMIVKIAIDLSFHLWTLGIYRRWTGQTEGLAIGPALLASLAEPFSFQLLRHVGAIWGWIAFLSGRERWTHQERSTLFTQS